MSTSANGTHRRPSLGFITALAALALYGCGGGGGGSSPPNSGSPPTGGSPPTMPSPPPVGVFTPGVFLPSAMFANQCAMPRSGTDPSSGQPFPDSQGSVLSENNYLRSMTNETYFWYRDVVDQDPSTFNNTLDYFDVLKTMAKTASGADQDRFHFTVPTATFAAFAESGVQAGYGVQFSFRAATAPRDIVVAFIEPNSPAAMAGIARGDRLLAVDGVDAVTDSTQAGVDILNAGLFPAQSGESHMFSFFDRSANANVELMLTAAAVTSVPVQNVTAINTPSGTVGYLQFNDHIATAEQGLINAINTLKAWNVTDLVLDVRYNGGGFLDIASQLSYMIAGTVPTAGRPFERIVFNDKNPTTNPITGRPLTPTPFHTTTLGFSPTLPQGMPLPTLDLQRVYVLTTADTCSASESIINGLRGVDVQVIQIGSTTCGKPFGFFPDDNCGTTYFSIQFQGLNAKNFGDYPDGFTPANALVNRGTAIEGCSVADDFEHALGDRAERLLATALDLRMGGSCPTPPSSLLVAAQKSQGGSGKLEPAVMLRSPAREIRLLRAAP